MYINLSVSPYFGVSILVTTKRLHLSRALQCFLPTLRIFLMTENFCVSIKLSSITRMAMLTSSSVTYSRRCIFACASAIRIMDSIWRTVMGIEPVAFKKQKKNKNTHTWSKTLHYLMRTIVTVNAISSARRNNVFIRHRLPATSHEMCSTLRRTNEGFIEVSFPSSTYCFSAVRRYRLREHHLNRYLTVTTVISHL